MPKGPVDETDLFPLSKFERTQADVTLSRSVSCDFGSCKATFQTVDARDEHKRIFHTPLW
jgi:hypothetical protein